MARQQLGAEHYQTFQIKAPKETHTVEATCEDVECQAYKNGWRMTIDLGTDLGQKQAWYIKYKSGRSFVEVDNRDGLVTIEFRSGQKCFQEHRQAIERDPVFSVKGGKDGKNPLRIPTRVHKKPEFWVEEFAENQNRLAEIHEKG